MTRRSRLRALCSCVLAAAIAVARAQTPAPPPEAPAPPPEQLATVEVLGSHIRRVDIETQHPLLTLDRAEILRTGLTSVSDVVQQIVANGETLNRHVNNGATGEQLINLRSLGANRTLVLLNGQRLVTDIDGAVDLSAIPISMVDRVEVLLDSASAIYGSDAIAGVINIITRRDYDGGELGAYRGQTDYDDGERVEYELSYGRKGDGWSGAAGVEYSRDDPVFAGSRAISAVPRFGLPPSFAGSSFTPYSWLAPAGKPNLRLKDGAPGTSPDDFRPVDRFRDSYNFAPFNYLETPQRRRAFYAQADRELGAALALHADFLFNQRGSDQQLAPPAIGFALGDTGQTDAFGISSANVYNPFGKTIVRGMRRLLEAGPRVFDQTADTARMHVGIDGAFALAGRGFTWAADAIATRVRVREFTGTYADNRKLSLAVGPSYFDAGGVARCGTPDAPVADCVPIDLFGPPGSITPAMLDYIDATEINRTSNDSRVVDARVSTNELFALPAGGVGFAAGVQYRRESGEQIIDPLRSSGNENGNGTSSESTTGAYSVREAYAEFDAPLVADKPFARKLDVIVGTRYSHYTNFGGTTNSQFGLRWKPHDDVLVRANYAEGFRAPAITELFGGTTRGPGEPNDPCDPANPFDVAVPTAATLARCAQLGVPANVDSLEELTTVQQGGNPALQPETSRSAGVGAVYTPQWLDGADISLDWYRIRVREAIGDPGSQTIVDDCYVRNSDAACALITRNPDTGTIVRIVDLVQNIRGGLETEGYDLTFNWRGETPLGRVSAHWVANYVDYYGALGQPAVGEPLPDGSTSVGNLVGFPVVWRWRSLLQVAWRNDTWSASATARYFSHFEEACPGPVRASQVLGDPAYAQLCSDPDTPILIGGQEAPKNHVSSVTFTDVEATWTAPWNAHVTVGVRNALDRTPPVSYSAFANSFFSDYDLPGRFWYLRYRQQF